MDKGYDNVWVFAVTQERGVVPIICQRKGARARRGVPPTLSYVVSVLCGGVEARP